MIKRIRVQAKVGIAVYTLLRQRTARELDEYDYLIEAIVKQASRDLKSKNYDTRTDAMDFFRSLWFTELTGLDGEEIIQRLLDRG